MVPKKLLSKPCYERIVAEMALELDLKIRNG